MIFSPSHRQPFRAAPLFVVATLILLAGCAGPPPATDIADRAALMANLTGALDLRRYGEPLDIEVPSQAMLTLADAIEQALRHDPEVQASLARVRSAFADAEQTRLLPNPVLSVAVRFPEGGGRATVEAGLGADLLSLFNRPRRISAADKRLRAAASEALVTVLDRLAEVQERYAAVQALDAQLLVLGEQQRLIERLLQLAQSRVEAGESSRLDVLTLDTERVRVEAEVLDARTQRQDERMALTRLIGQPSGRAEWELQPSEPPSLVPVGESEWIEAALRNRPEVQAVRWELAALGDEAALSRWTVLDGGEIGVDAEREDNWGIGPAISTPLPLLDWGQAKRDRAEAERIEVRHRLVHAQRQVVEDVRRALVSLVGSQLSLTKMRDELIPLLERRHEQANDAYRAGLSGITDVLLAEQELQQARGRLVELQQQMAVAQSRLHRAVGGPGIAATTVAPTTRPGTQSPLRSPAGQADMHMEFK